MVRASSASHSRGARAHKKPTSAGIAGANVAQMMQAARTTTSSPATQPPMPNRSRVHVTGSTIPQAGHSKITPAGHKPPFNAVLKAATMRFGPS
jgi:hypothetical protein